MFELSWMNNMLGPLKGVGFLGISFREGIDGLAYFPGRDGTQSPKCPLPENTEPALHLVQPRSMSRGIVDMAIGMSGQPPIMLGFMGVQVIQNDMQVCDGVEGNNVVHEVQELPATATRVMGSLHQPRGHFQGGKQGRSSVSFILVTEPPHSLSIRQTQPPLGTLQHLNGWLLIDTDNNCVFRWIQV